MKNLIVANWKMNPQTYKEAEDLAKDILKGAEAVKDVEVVICPPFVYLPLLKDFTTGGQNCFYEESGAYTGEISPVMLKNLGAEYVIIGHSERRKYFNETNEAINKKIKKALELGLKVIFCVGETAEERDGGKKNEVLENQLKEGLKEIDNFSDINIAYEPVWAIGTGNNCNVAEAKDAMEFIKNIVKENTRILYGGSVKLDNSASYIKEAGYNGLLVGGASLKPDEFVNIIKSAE